MQAFGVQFNDRLATATYLILYGVMADSDSDEKPGLSSPPDVRKFTDSFRAEPRFKEVPINFLNNFSNPHKDVFFYLAR